MKYFFTLAATLFTVCIFAASPVKVGVLLPLHNDDADGRKMVEFYRGLLFAVDSLKQEGFSVNVKTHNLRKDASVDSVLAIGDMADREIIFGPQYTNQVYSVSMLSKYRGIKLVVPTSTEIPELQYNPNLFQSFQAASKMGETIVKNFMSFVRYDRQVQVVIIDCNDTDNSRRSDLTDAMKAYCKKNSISCRITNINQTDKAFLKAFNKKNKRNIVLLNSTSLQKLTDVFIKLTALRETFPEIQISVLGYNEWMRYETVQRSNFCQNDVYYPSTFYYDRYNESVTSLENKYRKWFRQEPLMETPRFVLLGFDQGYYFIKGLIKYGKEFVGSKEQEVSKAIQSPMHFEKVSADGGYQNNSIMFLHYKTDKSVDMIKY